MSIRTLVLCDDLWHPGRIVRSGLGDLKDSDFSFDCLGDADAWSDARLSGYSLVVLAKSNHKSSTDQSPWLSQEGQGAFFEHVRRGGGLAVFHSGTAGYDGLPVVRGLTGGAFLHHPPVCPVTLEPLAGQPLTSGALSCMVNDEHYFVALDDQDANVFLHSRSEHGVQPAGWTRVEGEGRVSVLTPGHNQDVWSEPSFKALVANALRWAAKRI